MVINDQIYLWYKTRQENVTNFIFVSLETRFCVCNISLYINLYKLSIWQLFHLQYDIHCFWTKGFLQIHVYNVRYNAR